MKIQAADLTRKHCKPCEGDVPGLNAAQVKSLLPAVPKWRATTTGNGIRREWKVKDFATALDFFQRVGKVAEAQDHHPDLHLTGYRNVAIELSTHALGGLSENDFILAAKIDRLPVKLKAKSG
jgi:4a-hydroxytetrahydrobiopterin dehydratase